MFRENCVVFHKYCVVFQENCVVFRELFVVCFKNMLLCWQIWATVPYESRKSHGKIGDCEQSVFHRRNVGASLGEPQTKYKRLGSFVCGEHGTRCVCDAPMPKETGYSEHWWKNTCRSVLAFITLQSLLCEYHKGRANSHSRKTSADVRPY